MAGRDIACDAGGVTLRGWFFPAEGASAPGPVVVMVPSELAIAAFDSARQPKELVIVPGGPFDAYVKSFETFSGLARNWFTRYA